MFMECPMCGHQLSMYRAPELRKGERRAAGVAARVATWWFPTAILVLVGVGCECGGSAVAAVSGGCPGVD